MSYNSMIEIENVLPSSTPSFQDTAMIACALKSLKIHFIVLIPMQSTYQIIRTIMTEN